MGMTARNYSNNANVPVLTAGVSALATVLSTSTISNWPSAPCTATIDLDGSSPEVVQVTSIGAGTMTVIRAQGGTSAAIHDAGITITHTAVALDYSEANTHVNASTGVHGAAGAVVGTTDTQTLTNKTLTSPGLDTATVRASSSAPGTINKAAATGTQDISQWATSAGVVLSKVDVAGGVQAPTVVAAGTAAGSTPVTVKGASGQTAKVVSVQTNLGTEQLGVDKLGKVRIAPLTDEATALLIIKMAGLSANPIEIRDSSDVIKWRVGGLGDQIVTGLSLLDNGAFDKISTDDMGFRLDTDNKLTAANFGGLLDYAQSTSSLSTATTTELRDTGVDKVVFTAVAGRAYRVTYTARADSSLDDTTMDVRIRDGGGSTPTNASTAVAGCSIYLAKAGGPGATQVHVSQIVTGLAAGTRTFSPFYIRTSGSGAVKLSQASFQDRELTIEDMGTA